MAEGSSAGSSRSAGSPGHLSSNSSDISRRQFLISLASVATLPLALSQSQPAGAQARSFFNFKPFSFGYVTDVHLTIGHPDGFRLLQQSQLFLQDCIKTLNSEGLDFVVFGGDQVEYPGKDDSNWQLFLDVAQSLNCPWTFVLGEADVSGTLPVDKWSTYGPDWRGHGIETDKPYWSQTPLPSVHLIGLDTSRANSTTGEVSKEQLDWLRAEIAAHRSKFTIVFSHHPLLPPPPFDTGPPWDDSILTQGATVREILNRSSSVRLAVSGHVNVSKIQRERGIWYVSSPSLVVYPCAFRIFRVTPDDITVETYQVSFPALIKKARQSLQSSTLAFQFNEAKPQKFLEVAEGSRLDQDAELPFDAMGAQPIDKRKLEKRRKEKESRKEQEEKAPNKKKDKREKKKPKEKSEKERSESKKSDSDRQDAKNEKRPPDDLKEEEKPAPESGADKSSSGNQPESEPGTDKEMDSGSNKAPQKEPEKEPQKEPQKESVKGSDSRSESGSGTGAGTGAGTGPDSDSGSGSRAGSDGGAEKKE